MRVLGKQFEAASDMVDTERGKRRKRSRDCPRVTVRLSPDDHAKLTDLADGVALSVYLRAKALGEELPRRRAKGMAAQDRVAIAKIIGLLGQSRIANNLNQLAYHANVGSFDFNEETKAQIDEAYQLVIGLRANLIKALGLKT